MRRPQEWNTWLRAVPIGGGLLLLAFAIGGWCWSVSYRLGRLEQKMDTLLKMKGVKVAEQ